MASSAPQYLPLSAQEHTPTCVEHNLILDIVCEDCDKFICKQCAKTDHKDHDWDTVSTAANIRRRKLKEYLLKIKEEDVKDMDEKIQKTVMQMEANQKCCDSEVSKLQNHNQELMSTLTEIKKNYTKTLREDMNGRNAVEKEKKSNLKKKKEQVMDLVKFLKEKHSTMSDYSLLDNLRCLTNMMSNNGSGKEEEHSVKYDNYGVRKALLKLMVGESIDLNKICVSEMELFQNGDKPIKSLEACTEHSCFLRESKSEYVKEIQFESNGLRELFAIKGIDACIDDKLGKFRRDMNDVYVTDRETNSIVRLSPSNSVSTVFNTAPLLPIGICKSMEGGLLITLRDLESESYQLDSQSKRMVRHVTLNGDVIREYEYQEDGRTRLFTVPLRVKQNYNTDICVVNRTSSSSSELVILSSSGSLRSVYSGNKPKKCFLSDIACDLRKIIFVSDFYNSNIHVLSPDGELMKYLLTENEVSRPLSMSLFETTLWIGNSHGLVKMFQCDT